MRIFVSSTFVDLAEHRRHAIQALRELGHEVVAMEEFTAASAPPWDSIRERIDRCEAYVGIFAWRYGFLIDVDDLAISSDDDPPQLRSFTHWEYIYAKQKGLHTLAFLLSESTPWPPDRIDAFDAVEDGTKAAAAHGIMTLRRELQTSRVVGYFSSPDDLATRVATAVTNLGIGQRLFKNVIRLTEPVPVGDASFFGDISLEIQRASLSGRRVSTVNISDPRGWWSTRLYLLAVLAEALTKVQRIAIVDQAMDRPVPDANGANGFVGMLSTSTVARTMGRLFPVLTPLESEVRTWTTEGLVQEVVLSRAEEAWNQRLPYNIELEQKRDVTRPNLVTWFGDAMFTGTVDVNDVEAPTLLDVVRILGYPNDFVPVGTRRAEEHPAAGPADGAGNVSSAPHGETTWSSAPVTLIDKHALNQQLAQQYVDDLMDRARLR